MFLDYLLVITITSVVALVWRALLLDHKRLAEWIKEIPVVGGALYCGFCFTMWLSLFAVLVYNPVSFLFSNLVWVISVFFSWMLVSAGVLFIRNLLAVLMEANGVLTDKHRKMHEED